MEFIENFEYFSTLKSLYDLGIFNIACFDEEKIIYTHSCNINKPWCKRCAKCCYVWLGYMAFMDFEVVNKIFNNKNLFDLECN